MIPTELFLLKIPLFVNILAITDKVDEQRQNVNSSNSSFQNMNILSIPFNKMGAEKQPTTEILVKRDQDYLLNLKVILSDNTAYKTRDINSLNLSAYLIQ